jgi:hypothetical protein
MFLSRFISYKAKLARTLAICIADLHDFPDAPLRRVHSLRINAHISKMTHLIKCLLTSSGILISTRAFKIPLAGVTHVNSLVRKGAYLARPVFQFLYLLWGDKILRLSRRKYHVRSCCPDNRIWGNLWSRVYRVYLRDSWIDRPRGKGGWQQHLRYNGPATGTPTSSKVIEMKCLHLTTLKGQ